MKEAGEEREEGDRSEEGLDFIFSVGDESFLEV